MHPPFAAVFRLAASLVRTFFENYAEEETTVDCERYRAMKGFCSRIGNYGLKRHVDSARLRHIPYSWRYNDSFALKFIGRVFS